MWSEIKIEHYDLFYLKESFRVDIFTENYMDNSTFCSVENYKVRSKEDFLISLGNK